MFPSSFLNNASSRTTVVYDGSKVQYRTVAVASLLDITLVPNGNGGITSGTGRYKVVLVQRIDSNIMDLPCRVLSNAGGR